MIKIGAKKTFPLDKVKELIEQGYRIIDLAQEFNTSKPTMSNFL